MKHDLSPEIASKSLSALKVKIKPFFGKTISSWNPLQDRKEEILSELGDIVGSSAANAIGDMASQQVLVKRIGFSNQKNLFQAATREKYGIDVDDGDDNQNR